MLADLVRSPAAFRMRKSWASVKMHFSPYSQTQLYRLYYSF